MTEFLGIAGVVLFIRHFIVKGEKRKLLNLAISLLIGGFLLIRYAIVG